MKKSFVILLLLSINYLVFSQCDTTIVSEADGNWESSQLRHGVFIAQSESDYKKFYRYSSDIDFTNKTLISFYTYSVCLPARSELKITCRQDSIFFTYTLFPKKDMHQLPGMGSSNEFIFDKMDLSKAYFVLKVNDRRRIREWSAKYDNKSTIIKFYDEPITIILPYKKPNSN